MDNSYEVNMLNIDKRVENSYNVNILNNNADSVSCLFDEVCCVSSVIAIISCCMELMVMIGCKNGD